MGRNGVSKRFLFIVGAGASADFGFPLGSELASQLRDRLRAELVSPNDPRPILDTAMRSGLGGDYAVAARDLAGGLVSARSVDRLLDSRKDRPLVLELGKSGIVALIAHYERRSRFGEAVIDSWDSRQMALTYSSETWLARLFSLLHEGIPPADAARVFENCAFVTFNYDRCIERYLRLAFEHVLNLDPELADAIVEQIPIVHVYGSLGVLADPSGNAVLYGPSDDFFRNSVETIRTFSEGAEDGALKRVRCLVEQAERIVTLGFAFDPLNVSALFAAKLHPKQYMLATSVGLSETEQRALTLRLQSIGNQIQFLPANCKTLIDQEAFKTFMFN